MNNNNKEQEIQVAEEATEQDLEITRLRQKNLALQEQLTSMKNRSLQVYKENQQLQASPEIAQKMSELEYDLKLADNFARSGALPVKNAQQAYVIMKMGEEIGLEPMEAIQSIYIVNGQLAFHGKNMIARLTRLGYEMSYTNESRDGVTVTISHPKTEFVESYDVKRTEEALQKSKAMAFASKNKMRYHGVRQIINFHLAHHFIGMPIWDKDDYEAAEKRALESDVDFIDSEEENGIIDKLNTIDNRDDLVLYWNNLSIKERTDDVKRAFTSRKREIIENQEA